MTNILRLDPTRTTLLRRKWEADMKRRVQSIKKSIWKFLVGEDALGLSPTKSPLRMNAQARRFQFRTSAEKVAEFNAFLQERVEADLLTVGARSAPWSNTYVHSAYRKGVERAYVDSHKEHLQKPLDFYLGSKEEFLRSAFGAPETKQKLELLYTRTYEDLKGFTSAMAQQTSRALSDGIANGHAPGVIAKTMYKQIDGLTKKRALVIARTETAYAHSEGQLDAFERMEKQEVGVMAEWSTAGDDRVCLLCLPLEGKVFKVKDAHGKLPRHPNCRCAWVPANVGEETVEGKKKPPVPSGKRKRPPSGTGTPAPEPKVAPAPAPEPAPVPVTEPVVVPGEPIPPAPAPAPEPKLPKEPKAPKTKKAPKVKPEPAPAPVPAPKPPKELKAKELKAKVVKEPKAPKTKKAPKEKEVKRISDDSSIKTAKQYREKFVAEAKKEIDALPQVEEVKKLRVMAENQYRIVEMTRAESASIKALPDSSEKYEKYKKAEERRINAERGWSSWKRQEQEKEAELTLAKREIGLRLLSEKNSASQAIPAEMKKSLGAYQGIAEDLYQMIPLGKLGEKEQKNLYALTLAKKKPAGGANGQYRTDTKELLLRKMKPDMVFGTKEKFKTTAAHEIGHHISYQMDGFLKKQDKFFQDRTRGEEKVQLPGYGTNIRGKQDTFANYSVYAGRIYDDKTTPEIASVGIEFMYKDPLAAAEKDPEWFEAMLAGMKKLD